MSLEAGEAEDGERLKLRRWSVAGGGVNAVDCPRERRTAKIDVRATLQIASVTSLSSLHLYNLHDIRKL